MMLRLSAAALLLAAAPAAAQEEEPPADDAAAPEADIYDPATDFMGGGPRLSGEVSILSDYRFRGVSRSDEDPAVQAQLTVTLPEGFYAGARGTSMKDTPLGDVQLDVYAGYGAQLDLATTLDAGLLYYWFPDGTGATDYVEPYGSVSYLLGPAEAVAGIKYAPSQAALGGEDLLYLFAELRGTVPKTPLALSGGLGRQEAGAFGSYWNWFLGARYAFGDFEAALRYVDTDLPPLPGQDAGLVASLGWRF